MVQGMRSVPKLLVTHIMRFKNVEQNIIWTSMLEQSTQTTDKRNMHTPPKIAWRMPDSAKHIDRAVQLPDRPSTPPQMLRPIYRMQVHRLEKKADNYSIDNII